MRFVCTNIFLRYLTRDDPVKGAAAFALFQRVRDGHETLQTCEAMIAEVVYVLASPRQYNLAPVDIRSRLRPVLRLPGLKVPQKRTILRALDLYASTPGLDFEDALGLAHMQQLGLVEIVSYDNDFDRIASITRIEP